LTAKLRRKIDSSAIHRAVASSTAIETGQSVKKLERRLRDKGKRRSDLNLAKPKKNLKAPGRLRHPDSGVQSCNASAINWIIG
jgi:hypothetical protein